MDGLIEIQEESWRRGGTPSKGRIAPWGVQSIDHEDIDFWQGRLDSDLVDIGFPNVGPLVNVVDILLVKIGYLKRVVDFVGIHAEDPLAVDAGVHIDFNVEMESQEVA